MKTSSIDGIFRWSYYLPRLGLSSLILCLLSGIVLCFQYRPMGNVFQNMEEITTAIPYGKFFRQLHYGSGQLFVIMMLLHAMDHFLRGRYRRYSLSKWTMLIIPLVFCLFTLFTGFILKGDQEGTFAGVIMMNILKQVPGPGDSWTYLFIVPGEAFFFLPYLYHCLLLPLIIVFLIKDHIREWLPDLRFMMATAIPLFLYALVIEPSMDIHPQADVAHIKGPWFFVGIQSLLRIMPAIWAGLVIPSIFLIILITLPLMRGVWAISAKVFVAASLILYVVLTLYEFLAYP